MDVDLQMSAATLHEAVSDRSSMPPDAFALYYRSKQLEGGAALSSWEVGKGATIEVKTRGRGGARQAQGGASSKGEKEEKGAEMAAKAIADEAEDADASLAGKVWAIGGRVLDADNESNECVPLSLAAVFLEAMRRTELIDHLFSGALAPAHDDNVDCGMHELRSALEKLAARPLDAGIRSMDSVPTLAIRSLVSKLCAAEPKDMASQWHVSSEEAARVAVPSTTVPLGAVVALLQKLPVRVALFVHWGDHVERHEFGGSVEAPFVGGLIAREGHMSFVECDGAREHECDGALAEPTSEPLGLWEHEPVSSPHALVRLPDARVLKVPLECPADLLFDACKAHFGSQWVTLRYVLDARPFDEQRHQGTTIGELGLREGGTLSVLQGMVLGSPTARVKHTPESVGFDRKRKADKTPGGRDGNDRFHLEFCHTLSWELLQWINKLPLGHLLDNLEIGSQANPTPYDRLCLFMNSRGLREDGKDDLDAEARGNGRMKSRLAKSMIGTAEIKVDEARGNVGGIGTLSDVQLDEFIFALLSKEQEQQVFVDSKLMASMNPDLEKSVQEHFTLWCKQPDTTKAEWAMIDALDPTRKLNFLRALWQEAAIRAHEQAQVLIYGSRRGTKMEILSTGMPEPAREKLLLLYSKLKYTSKGNFLVTGGAGKEWKLNDLPKDLSGLAQRATFRFIYQLVCCKQRIAPCPRK